MSSDKIMLQCSGILHSLQECNTKLEKSQRETDNVLNKLGDFRSHSTTEGAEEDIKQSAEHHPKFYFNDGNVIFSVQETLFKVHRYFFERDPPVFAAMFSLPPPQSLADDEGELLMDQETPTRQKVEGETDDHPIVLEGVCAQQFEQFLSILYPSDFTYPDPVTAAEWTSVLNLATRWDFSSIRKLAISKLSCELIGRSPAIRLSIAKQYEIDEWLIPAYTALCVRNDPLDIMEGRALGLDDVIAIENIRHTVHYPSSLNRSSESVAKLVKHTFDVCQPFDEHAL